MRKSGIVKGGQPFVRGSRVVPQSFSLLLVAAGGKKQLCNSFVGNGCQDDRGICQFVL